MRLFVALDVPLHVKENIRKLQASLPSGVAPVRPEQCHVTLKFLGETENPRRVVEELRSVAQKPFPVTLDTIGGFPSLVRPKVVFLEGERTEELSLLVALVDNATKEFRAPRPFRFHVTFARLKEPVKFDFRKLRMGAFTFTVREFVLYRSALRAEGPEYSVVERFRLG